MKTDIQELIDECESLLGRINYAFYVKGTTKALLPVMAETKPMLERIRAFKVVEVESLPIISEGKSLAQMAEIMTTPTPTVKQRKVKL